MMNKITEEAIRRAKIRPPTKVDWTASPFEEVYYKGKNAKGDFGEFLYQEFCTQIKGISADIIHKGHDIATPYQKVEVKTSFQNQSGGYWFNQIYYECPDTGVIKDWDTLVFVFVRPDGVEMWEASRPRNPDEEFKRNNGYSWCKSSPAKLSQKWSLIHKEDCL